MCNKGVYMYTGELVRLRDYGKEDLEMAKKFVNTPEVKQYVEPGIPYLYTLANEEKWYEAISANSDTYNFAIEDRKTGKYLGGCGVNEVDWKNSKVVVGIFIGASEYRNKGYGTDAMKVLVKFIFEQMNINKVKLGAYSFNQRAIRCYEKVGFQVEGVLKEELFRNGKYHDIVEMSIFKKDYFSRIAPSNDLD